MGVTYHGPYAEAIGYDDHEGYAARILPDGTETAVWTYETREFRAYRTRCACGWRGSGRYPATDTGEDAALDEWDHDHLQPLVPAEASKHTILALALLSTIRDLRAALAYTVDPAVIGGRRLTVTAALACATPSNDSNTY